MSDFGFQYFSLKNPESTAVIESSGKTWSRQVVSGIANALARGFVSEGLVAEDAIGIVSPNCMEFIAAYFAAVQANLFVVPMNWHLAPAELNYIFKDADVRCLIVHPELGPWRLQWILENAPLALRLSIGRADGYIDLYDFIKEHTTAPHAQQGNGRVMPYTSATTGLPKAVQFTLENAHTSMQRIVRWNETMGVLLEDGNVHLCPSMLYHSAPLQGAVTALNMGHTVVLVRHWEPEQLLRLIHTHAITTAFMVPTMFIRLLKLPAKIRESYSARSLRFVIHAGAPCPIDTKRAMIAWWGEVIWDSYGAAEGQGTIVGAAEWLRHPGTVGRPIPGSAIKIIGADGQELGPGEVGEIYLRPHTGDTFKYRNDPDKTRRCMRGDFITVGDLGYVDVEGFLFVVDRSADLIISSGMNIYSAEIEAVLVQHPLVRDCAVVAVSNNLLGQVPKAFVELEPQILPSSQLSGELLQFLARRLSVMKLPKEIEYVPTLPRDPAGKLFKRRLLERDRAN